MAEPVPSNALFTTAVGGTPGGGGGGGTNVFCLIHDKDIFPAPEDISGC